MTIQIALRFGVLPDAVENLGEYWRNRLDIFFCAEAEAEKIK
jgi:hypothetical protein